MSKQYIRNIQTLRGIAALVVVFAHTVGTAAHYQFTAEALQKFNAWGASGVDIFFVISGFIMFYITQKNPQTPYQFLRARFIRIIPLYWVLTTLVIALMVALPQIFKTTDMPPSQIIASFFFLSQITHNNAFPLIGAGWSLEYEMLFYIIFAGCLFCKNKYGAALIASICLLLVAYYTPYSFIVIELILGMTIGVIYIHKKLPISWGVGFFIIGILLHSANLIFDINFNLDSRIIYFGTPACLFVLGCLYMPQIKNQLCRLLGDASYSIYLIQFFTIPFFYKAMSHLGIDTDFAYILAVICIIFTAIAGIMIYYILEKPLIALFNNRPTILNPS